MRRLASLGMLPLLLALGCRPGHGANDRILDSLSVADAALSLYPEHILNRKGGSLGGGSAADCFEKSEIFVVAGRSPLPDNFVASLAESLASRLSRAGATSLKVDRTCEIQYAREYKHLAPDSQGGRVLFSIAGSRGVLSLRYTTVTAKDSIGYLTSEIVEFRN
jgi:hypothetical protein